MTDAAAAGAAAAPQERLGASAWSWALYEAGRNPYVIVCSIYVFAPYVANYVIGDPVQGLKQIADLNKWAGLAVALLAPLVGAIADRAGRRKIPLAFATYTMAGLVAALWLVTPDAPTALWFSLLFAIGLLYPLSEALHNAMLPGATSARALPKVSGLGLALGAGASVLILLFALFALVLPAQPLFGLDKAAHEPERAIGPILALWMAALVTPLFLFTSDTPRGEPWINAARSGVASLRGAIGRVRAMPNVTRFLVARMLYADAMTAIVVLGGVYVSGIMGWGLEEMVLYGILLTTISVLGGFVAGWMDRALGTKRALMIECAMVALGQLLVVSIDRDTVFFVFDVPTRELWNGPFATPAELTLLGVVLLLPIFITASYASSRTMLAQLAPPNMTGELFGLYALSGSATVWVGPLLVSTVTGLTQSAVAGSASLILLLAAGFWVLRRVREPARARLA